MTPSSRLACPNDESSRQRAGCGGLGARRPEARAQPNKSDVKILGSVLTKRAGRALLNARGAHVTRGAASELRARHSTACFCVDDVLTQRRRSAEFGTPAANRSCAHDQVREAQSYRSTQKRRSAGTRVMSSCPRRCDDGALQVTSGRLRDRFARSISSVRSTLISPQPGGDDVKVCFDDAKPSDCWLATVDARDQREPHRRLCARA